MKKESLTYKKLKNILISLEEQGMIEDLECFGSYHCFYDRITEKHFSIKPVEKQRIKWFKGLATYQYRNTAETIKLLNSYDLSGFQINYDKIMEAIFKSVDKELFSSLKAVIFFWNREEAEKLIWSYTGKETFNSFDFNKDKCKYVFESDIILVNMDLIAKTIAKETAVGNYAVNFYSMIIENIIYNIYRCAEGNRFINDCYADFDFSDDNVTWVMIKPCCDALRYCFKSTDRNNILMKPNSIKACSL